MADAPLGCEATEGKRGSRSDMCVGRATEQYRSGSGPLRVTSCNLIFTKNYISFPSSPRDRALVFSARAPFAFVPAIPKTANKYAGGAEGGFQGGIPPRPPLSAFPSPFFPDFQFSAILCCFLVKVRTFFSENPAP